MGMRACFSAIEIAFQAADSSLCAWLKVNRDQYRGFCWRCSCRADIKSEPRQLNQKQKHTHIYKKLECPSVSFGFACALSLARRRGARVAHLQPLLNVAVVVRFLFLDPWLQDQDQDRERETERHRSQYSVGMIRTIRLLTAFSSVLMPFHRELAAFCSSLNLPMPPTLQRVFLYSSKKSPQAVLGRLISVTAPPVAAARGEDSYDAMDPLRCFDRTTVAADLHSHAQHESSDIVLCADL